MKKFTRREFIPLIGLSLVGASCMASTAQETTWMGIPNRIRPKKLEKGDVIGICAPAGAIKDSKEIGEFESIIQSLGYQTNVAKHTAERYGYFSAPDKTRAKDFMDLVEDESVKAIFFIRGGWGCARMIEYIDFKQIQSNPKIIMGFSDLTSLLNAITLKSNLVTFHGPGGNSSWNDYSTEYLTRILTDSDTIDFENKSDDIKPVTIRSGYASGELAGGNLSVICSMIGSGYLPNWSGKILFLEDVMEEPYRIDRMLTQLKLSGIIDQLSGIVLGDFRKCEPEEPEFSFTLEEVFEQHFAHLDIPVFSNAQFGHTKYKYTLPIGIQVQIDADKGTIHMLEYAVR